MEWFHREYPSMTTRFFDSITYNQIECKKVLIDGLDKVKIPRDKDGKIAVEIIGSWYGFPLLELLHNKLGKDIKSIILYEPDKFSLKVTQKYLQLWKDNPDTDADMHYNISMFNMDYFHATAHNRRAHLIINTSCEHMKDMAEMKRYYQSPERTLLALQSTNFPQPDHCNLVKSNQQLAKQAGIKELHGDTIRLHTYDEDNKKVFYERFSVLGKWT